MKSKVAVACFLLGSCITTLAGALQPTARMVRKADDILRQTTVVSNRAVGYGGECPEANWALSVVCASKDDPAGHLIDLSEQCQAAGFVMCMLGVRALDEKRFASEFAARRTKIEEAKLTVETAIGCFFEKKPALQVLEEKGWSRDWLICDPLPELWETIRVDPITESFDEKANQPPQRNAGSRPISDDSPASETPSSLGPRG